MAKASSGKKPAASPDAPPTPAAAKGPAVIRAKIRRLDHELVKLVNQRGALVVKLHEAAGPDTPRPSAEAEVAEVLADVMARHKGPLTEVDVQAVFREVCSGCRALTRRMRVAFLGPEYSYSHLAAIHAFGQAVDLVPVGSIAAVFEEVNRGLSDCGVVPIENSTDGRIADTLDMFTRLPVRICRDVELQIHHTLLGKCLRSEVTEVYSKPQALSQCRNWLARHLPSARTVEVTSTTAAAELAKQRPGTAAIASAQAGIHYDLDVLADQIEDNPANTTRFAVIGQSSAPRSGHDRTAIMFQLEHRPGTLAEAMAIFKRNRLNLTWIESFPALGEKRAYLFFIEMEGHETDVRVRRAVAALGRKTVRLEILGSYAAAEPAPS